MSDEILASTWAYRCGRLLAALIEAEQALDYAQAQVEDERDRKVLLDHLNRVRTVIQIAKA